MNQECQIQVIIIKPRVTVAFVRVYHVRYFFCKKGNYFWGLCFRRVVIFGGSLLSGFANTCDILSLVSEVGLLLSWIPAWSSAPFEGPSRGRYFRNFTVRDKLVEDFRRLTTTSPRTSADYAGKRWYPVPIFCWFQCGFGFGVVLVSFRSVDLMVESKMMLFALVCLLSTVRLSHSDPGYSMNGTVYYTKG